MKDKKDIQVEDSPSLEAPIKTPEPAVEPQVPVKPGFVKRALPWIIVSLVFFLLGASLIYYTLYTKAEATYKTAQENAAQLTDQLSTSQVDLTKAKTELGTTQASLVDANNAATKSQQLSILYKFEADVNLARVGLLKLDPTTARQALSVAGDDLKNLTATSISPDSISGLQPQLDNAVTFVEADPAKAMDALDTLYTNLLLISENIK